MVDQRAAPTRHAAPTRRRTRRTGDEVRRLLLETARARFSADGYAGASTKTIATEAGLSETLIFNHFITKAGLFEAAVLEPFARFIDDYVARFRDTPMTADLAAETRLYVAKMFELLRDHRNLVLALIATEAFDLDGLGHKVNQTFTRLLVPIEDMVSREWAERGWRGFDTTIVVRALIGMIMSMSVLDGVLCDPSAARPDDERIVDQLTRLLVDGYGGLSRP